MKLIAWMLGDDIQPMVYKQQITPMTATMITTFRQIVVLYPVYALIVYITN
jgi:hypothetical protein